MRTKHIFHEESFWTDKLARTTHFWKFFYLFRQKLLRREILLFSFWSQLVKQYVAENERLRAILGEWSMRAAKVQYSLSILVNVVVRNAYDF